MNTNTIIYLGRITVCFLIIQTCNQEQLKPPKIHMIINNGEYVADKLWKSR